MNVIPVILSGGSGTRLWPLSRSSRPKQFLNFGTGLSLFQDTVLRCRSKIFDTRPIVVGADSHRFLIAEALQEIGAEADILLEPVPRNSCAAIAVGCLHALQRDADAIVLVLAADHHIPDRDAFCADVARGGEDADAGHLLTFGVRPDRPTNAYGYILPGEQLVRAARVRQFREKPPLEVAKQYITEGYLWNSGNFLFRSDAFLKELDSLAPSVLAATRRAWQRARSDLQFMRLDAVSFADAPAISVDHAVMERTTKAAVLPVGYAWSDVGSWDAVSGILQEDDTGNTIIGDATIIGGSDNLVHSNGKLTTLIGVDGLVVVSTPDCVLVVPKDRAEEVKTLVSALETRRRREATEALQVFRPWGNYEQLDSGEGYQVKRIIVKPGGVLSLQWHRHRAEHWVVVQGEAEVTLGDDVEVLGANQSVYVPLGAVHRVANRRSEPLVLIEVQTGSYLGEDDIIRLDDNYNRQVGETESDRITLTPAESRSKKEDGLSGDGKTRSARNAIARHRREKATARARSAGETL